MRAASGVTAPQLKIGARGAILKAYGRLPVAFRPNVGQADRAVQFSAAAGGASIFLTSGGVTISLPTQNQLRGNSPRGQNPRQTLPGASEPGFAARAEVLRLAFPGISPTRITGSDPVPGLANYLIGRDPRSWRTNVSGYREVVYSGAYPGVDLVFRATGGNLEYDFLIAPGASPDAIGMSYGGTAQVALLASGDLSIGMGAGSITQKAPIAYQTAGRVRQPVAMSYISRSRGVFGFAPGTYDHTRPLVIDPLLVYSTYLGGSGYDAGYSIGVDASGAAYVAGVSASTNFPGTSGPPPASGNAHAFVTKINPAGSAVVYSTYVGGSGNDEALGVAVDGGGSAYITGATTSTDFPTVSAAIPTAGGGVDSFVTKLSPSGSSMAYSSYLGGASYDIGYGIAIDPTQNAYIAGLTSSSNFPVVGGLPNAVSVGHSHGFVTKFSAAGMISYSTLIGGSGDDGVAAVTVDWLGDAYVTGITNSPNFPIAGAAQPGQGGGGDGFVSKLNPTGSGLVFSTYLGGSGYDEGLAIALDQSDNVFVAGVTASPNFPLTGAWQGSLRGSANAFATKLSSTGAAIDYSTYLGGSGTDLAYGIAVDWSGFVYVTGVTSSANFPNVYGSQPFTGTSDGFLSVITPAGSLVVYSTFIGGSGDSQVRGVFVDGFGNIYLAGATTSPNFPSQGGFQSASGGSSDAFVAKVPSLIPSSWWTTYLADTHHTGANTTQQLLNRGTAGALRNLWTDKVGGYITTQVVVGNGMEYFGSWDGYERAVDPSGRIVWATYVGVTTNTGFGCLGGSVGVASIATLITVNGGSVLYVGGGDAAMYALNAMTGQVIWRTSLGTPPAQFLWASPTFYNGSVYEGVGSFQECPAVQGQEVQMDAATGAIQHMFKTVPDGCTGAPVLATAAVDEVEGAIYIATGNSPNSCPGPYDVAVVKLRASDLTPLDQWQIPAAEQVITDPDFGASPMLFTATIGGTVHDMVGLLNKNGTYYAFDRHALGAGPVWRATGIGVGGNCPVCGSGSPISPSSYDGHAIYVGSNQTTINGVTCTGSVRALDPATGAFIWQKCLASPVLGAVTVSQGVAVAGAGPDIIVMSTADGLTLITFHDPNPAPAPLTGSAKFWSGPTIVQGVIYLGNIDGNLYALSL